MDYTALISGLVGALVGALASVATIYIQGLLQNRLETRRLLYETAYKDYELRILHPGPNSPGVAAFPVILSYHQKMAALVESGKLTPNSAAEILESQTAMLRALSQAVTQESRKDR
jgi:hypothetical protein